MTVRRLHRVFMTSIAIAVSAASAASQITITQADVESLAGKFQVSYPALAAPGFDLSLSGPGRTWDLTAYTYDANPDLRLTHLVFPPAGGPDVGNPAFATANYAIKSEAGSRTSWQYAKVSSAGVEVVGNIDTATYALAPGLKIMGAFAVGYGSAWSSQSAVSSSIIPTGFSASIAGSGSIDSWGTMILPAGGGGTVSKNVIRLKLLQTTTIRIGTFVITQFSSTSYQWLTSASEGQFYVASASTDSVGGLKVLSYYTPFNAGPTSVLALDGAVPQSAQLLPNYPNPFNPQTKIPFVIASEGPVSIAVYNVLGQNVAVLVQGSLAPGSYATTFDARNLPAGTYIVKLESGSSVSTRKIMLVR